MGKKVRRSADQLEIKSLKDLEKIYKTKNYTKPMQFKKEGEDHINISLYSNLFAGRFLDPSHPTTINYPAVGKFASVLNLVYWLKDADKNDIIRTMNKRLFKGLPSETRYGKLINHKVILLVATMIKLKENPKVVEQIMALPDDIQVLSYTIHKESNIRITTNYAHNLVPVITEAITAIKKNREVNYQQFLSKPGTIENGYLENVIPDFFKVVEEVDPQAKKGLDCLDAWNTLYSKTFIKKLPEVTEQDVEALIPFFQWVLEGLKRSGRSVILSKKLVVFHAKRFGDMFGTDQDLSEEDLLLFPVFEEQVFTQGTFKKNADIEVPKEITSEDFKENMPSNVVAIKEVDPESLPKEAIPLTSENLNSAMKDVVEKAEEELTTDKPLRGEGLKHLVVDECAFEESTVKMTRGGENVLLEVEGVMHTLDLNQPQEAATASSVEPTEQE